MLPLAMFNPIKFAIFSENKSLTDVTLTLKPALQSLSI
jgi:hypothetical protein